MSKLSGQARNWHANFGRDYETWAEWKTAFLTNFDRQKSLMELTMDLEKRKQTEDETLSDYAHDKLKLFRNSGIAVRDQDKIDAILCKGIRNDASRSVLWKQHDSIESFFNELRIRERYEEHEKTLICSTAAKPKRQETSDDDKDSSGITDSLRLVFDVYAMFQL